MSDTAFYVLMLALFGVINAVIKDFHEGKLAQSVKRWVLTGVIVTPVTYIVVKIFSLSKSKDLPTIISELGQQLYSVRMYFLHPLDAFITHYFAATLAFIFICLALREIAHALGLPFDRRIMGTADSFLRWFIRENYTKSDVCQFLVIHSVMWTLMYNMLFVFWYTAPPPTPPLVLIDDVSITEAFPPLPVIATQHQVECIDQQTR